MPLPYADIFGDKEPAAAVAKTSAKATTGGSAGKGIVSANPRAAEVGPQRTFLHSTLQAIGTELDKQNRSESKASSSRPHPHGSVMDSEMVAWGVREELGNRFATHTDAELEELEAAVESREQEVLMLSKQVEQAERQLSSTRAACERRAQRQRGEGGSKDKKNGGSIKPKLGTVMANTKDALMSSAGATVWDADESAGAKICSGSTPNKKNAIEEWQHAILRMNEISQSLRVHVDEQARGLHQQTVQRKAQESQLFSTHVATLKVRSQALSSEARVQRLANELSRLYHCLPETMHRKLHGDAESIDTRKYNAVCEVRSLKVENHGEFFKFLDCEKIQDESDCCQKKIAEFEELINLAHQVLEKGQWFAESGVSHADAAEVAINALHDRWARFSAAGHPAGELTIKDNAGEKPDDADCILHRATLSVRALTALNDSLLRGQPCDSKAAKRDHHARNDDFLHAKADEDHRNDDRRSVQVVHDELELERGVDDGLPQTLDMPWAL